MVPPVTEMSLFAPDPESAPEKPPSDQLVWLRVMITVKAAPNPSEQYGETVCVAGIRLDPDNSGWVRLTRSTSASLTARRASRSTTSSPCRPARAVATRAARAGDR